MSYSTKTFRGATLAALMAAAAVAFDDATKSQPVHVHDRNAHLSNFATQAQLLGEPKEGHEYSGSFGGYLSWSRPLAAGETPLPGDFTSAGFSCSVGIVLIEVPKTA